MSAQASLRIMKELKEFQDRPDTNLFVHSDETNVMKLNALLIGPEDTPYEYGMFEFLLAFPNDYPSKAPHVAALTTNMGRTRFNPNIYASGKVCLSILGTWRGESGEEWRSSQGFQSVLVSILSLMNQDPYKNEPGYEDYDKPTTPPPPPTPVSTPPITIALQPPAPPTHHAIFARRPMGSETEAKCYIRKIRHETLRISVIQRLEAYLNISQDAQPAAPTVIETAKTGDDSDDEETRRGSPELPEIGMWVDHCKRLFLCYYDIYMEIIKREQSEVKDGKDFIMMPFEGGDNRMKGKFTYPNLLKRLLKIRQLLDEETTLWAEQGPKSNENHERIASHLILQFNQCQQWFGGNPGGITLGFEMEKDNPFVWRMVYFGRPMTKWDGGLFTIRLVFPSTFPTEQPRVRIVTPIFHANVTSDGIPYYRVSRPESVQAHIEALIDIFEKDMNSDPSCVLNRNCAEMYWRKGEEGRKEYSKMIRKVVSRSVEYE